MVGNALRHALGRGAHDVIGEAGRALGSEPELSLDAGVGAVVLSEAAGGTLVELTVEGVPLLLEGGEVLGGVAADVVTERSLGKDEGENGENESEFHDDCQKYLINKNKFRKIKINMK